MDEFSEHNPARKKAWRRLVGGVRLSPPDIPPPASFDLFLCLLTCALTSNGFSLRLRSASPPLSLSLSLSLSLPSGLRFIFSSALPAFTISARRLPPLALPLSLSLQLKRSRHRTSPTPPFFYSTSPPHSLHALPVKRKPNPFRSITSPPSSSPWSRRRRRHCEIWRRRGSRGSSPRSRRRSCGGCRRRGPEASPRRRHGARRRRGC